MSDKKSKFSTSGIEGQGQGTLLPVLNVFGDISMTKIDIEMKQKLKDRVFNGASFDI